MTVAEVKRAFNLMAHKLHPDHGGDAADFRLLVAERDVALQWLAEKVAA
jgi:hypothetical protein